jgi:dipeptidyl aminopeptidase/acylaminoacyl peptidase
MLVGTSPPVGRLLPDECLQSTDIIDMRKSLLPKTSLFLVIGALLISNPGRARQAFTVADDIEMTHIHAVVEPVQFSPDGQYFVVYAERGRLGLNLVEDSLRFYRSQDVKTFLEDPEKEKLALPAWVVNRLNKEGPIIQNLRWLPDSSGVAFLERTAQGNQRLVLADVMARTVEPLTSSLDTVRTFDIRDRQHYIYTIPDPVELQRLSDEHRLAATVGTGRTLVQLVLPHDPLARKLVFRNYLRVVDGDRQFEVKKNGVPIVLFGFEAQELALSLDGKSLITKLPISAVPASWETLYPPPYASMPTRIRAGRLDEQTGDGSANQYVKVDLSTGSMRALTAAPTSNDGGWFVRGRPSWSSDGKGVLLPGTFLYSKDQRPSRPCIAFVDLTLNTSSCVETLKARTPTVVEQGYHSILDARFVDGDKHRVMVIFMDRQSQTRIIEYRHTADDTWQGSGESDSVPEVGRGDLQVTVMEGLNEPPLFVARDKRTSRVLWNPNPQFKNIEFGDASVYTWKDTEGRTWKGGLFKPTNYQQGLRYPLVIQTHGFVDSEFLPSGLFSTAFAARALAAAGIMVLQVGEHCPMLTPQEGPCAVSGYEGGANQLVSEGLVDPEKIGIIGFSRTCFYVMDTLTTGSLPVKAASINDGVMETYSQYLMWIERNPEGDSMIGKPPFGEGLQAWLKLSPGFNLDKVVAPLLISGAGPSGMLEMWEPYAGLTFLHKPVDLIMLNSDEHVITNPAVRMASQGGSVDWFRFWLQDYEDPDPAKVDQYNRWRELRRLQQAQNATSDNAMAVPSIPH